MENAPFLFEPEDYFGFFSRIGWKPKEAQYFATEAERLRRPAPFPLVTRVVMRILGFFASPERRREMKQYAGFVLFERKIWRNGRLRETATPNKSMQPTPKTGGG